MPVWQLLGGKVRDRIKVYGWIGGDTFKDLEEQAVSRQRQGFTAVKMNATGAGHYFFRSPHPDTFQNPWLGSTVRHSWMKQYSVSNASSEA